MTLAALPFTLERWADVALQPEQLHEPANHEHAAVLSNGHAVAMVDASGHTIGCGGLCPVGGDEAVAWTYIGRDAGQHMLGLVRLMRETLAEATGRYRVIKAATLDGFAPGCRMLLLLGFRLKDELDHNGRHYLIYERRESSLQ